MKQLRPLTWPIATQVVPLLNTNHHPTLHRYTSLTRSETSEACKGAMHCRVRKDRTEHVIGGMGGDSTDHVRGIQVLYVAIGDLLLKLLGDPLSYVQELRVAGQVAFPSA